MSTLVFSDIRIEYWHKIINREANMIAKKANVDVVLSDVADCLIL